jgi:hypothetical protein
MNEDILFVPVTCASCNRVSAVTLSKPLLRRQLNSGASVELFCVYDDVRWTANRDELSRMAKLLTESEQVAKSRWLRLRGQPDAEMRI